MKLFEDVTAAAGLMSYSGITYGAAWGDFDGDGLPDLYLTNHLNGALLMRNLGHGRFEDVTDRYFTPEARRGDKHGAAWAHLDTEGRLDLVQLTGGERGIGSEPKHLFLNRGDHFEDVGTAIGISNPNSRARMPLWFDFDGDGRLDLFEGAEARFDRMAPPFVFLQRDGKFIADEEIARFDSRSVPFCIVTDVENNGHADLVCKLEGPNTPNQILSTTTIPFRKLDLLPKTAFEDLAAGDFDNDGSIDLFLARKNPAPAVAVARVSDTAILADLKVDSRTAAKEIGFTFRSVGGPTIRVLPANPSVPLTSSQIHIGSHDTSPSVLEFKQPIGSSGIQPSGMTLKLQPGTDATQGIAAHRPGIDDGLYIGFLPPDKWQVLLSVSSASTSGDQSKYQQVAVKIESTAAISSIEIIGEPRKTEEAPFRLFMNRGGKLIEESEKRGVNARLVSAVNVVAGDFNNDMYLDLFVVASGDIGKQENLLLLNRGDGTFDVVAHAGGAAGDNTGVGDSVTTADLDGAGCLDLLVASGGSMGRSLGLPSEKGSYHLYRNLWNNGNHWLEIDLEGTSSNRDGIGARVELTAGGVSQVRIQDGGIHHRGQNHSRLHFGLAKNIRVDRIRIRWPSGTIQELSGVSADQIMRITEPAN